MRSEQIRTAKLQARIRIQKLSRLVPFRPERLGIVVSWLAPMSGPASQRLPTLCSPKNGAEPTTEMAFDPSESSQRNGFWTCVGVREEKGRNS